MYQRSLYLLVLNGRQGHEDADAEYWLNLVESFGKGSPIIVVLNKIKEQHFNVNRPELRQKFPAIQDFIETDCADHTGIDVLRQAIERETDRLEHLRDAFPANWFSIKDRLSNMKENYLTFEQYQAICTEHGETDLQAQAQLASYLHVLGIALNYREDWRLRDTHVLNPLWLTNGIYTIINAESLARQKGELHIDDLSHILNTNIYPPERHGFLLDLMRKFELAFSFPEGNDRYLVAGLLDKEQPSEALKFDLKGCLNFEYHYPITLPEGLLPRFIVRTHVLSTYQPRWRTGVILEFEQSQALVKADMQGKKVLIHIGGLLTSRQRLLAVIRTDFEGIHRDFTFKPQSMVPVPEHPDIVVPYEYLRLWEAEGRSTYSVPVAGKIRDLPVQDLLNGVDLKDTRRPQRETDRTTSH